MRRALCALLLVLGLNFVASAFADEGMWTFDNRNLNFVSTDDIMPGNSGWPVIGRNRGAIGLVFELNIEAPGGNFGYDGSVNRAVEVDVTGITEALKKIYHADRLVKELTP